MLSLYLVSELGNEDFMFNVELSDDEDLADSYNLIEEDKAIILKRQRTSDAEKCRASEITYDIPALQVPLVNIQFLIQLKMLPWASLLGSIILDTRFFNFSMWLI